MSIQYLHSEYYHYCKLAPKAIDLESPMRIYWDILFCNRQFFVRRALWLLGVSIHLLLVVLLIQFRNTYE